MNKTIIININSIVFHIEEDAYETLRTYMIDIKRHFSQSADSGEILLDIENRVAEMFMERIQQGKKEVISSQDVQEVIRQMGRVSDFEEVEELNEETKAQGHKEEPKAQEHKEEPKANTYEKKLLRSADDVVLGGVCSGLGYYFGIQTKWVRILFVLFFLFGGSGVLLYIVLWIVMPLATSRSDRMAMRGEEPNLQNFKKNFEEELENYKDDFSSAQGHISKGANAIGSGFASFFKFFGKGIAFLLLIFCGMTIFGMLFVLVGFGTAIFGLQNNMAFPGLDILPQGQALLALIAGVSAITIPFLAAFHFLVRILFKTRPMNNYLSLSLWAGWITAIILVLFFSFLGANEFKEDSTIKIDKPLVKQEVYYFAEKDIRVIEASTLDNGQKKYNIEVEGEELSSYLRRDINIRFEYLEENEAPFIQYNYFAKGKSYKAATKRASEINYLASQDKNKVMFDSHFSLGKNNDYRDQSVTIIVYLPIGSKVVLDDSLRDKVQRISYHDCKNEYSEDNVKRTEWIMKKSGLSCAPDFMLIPIEDDTIDEALKGVNEEIEKATKEIEKNQKIIDEIQSGATHSSN